jgi:hypothetical protein
MSVATRVLAFVLLLALLPWGAYAKGFGVADRDGPVVTAPEPGGGHPAAVAPAKRCKGPSLPGAICGPDLGLVTAEAALPDLAGSGPGWPPRLRLPEGREPPGTLDPPKVG